MTPPDWMNLGIGLFAVIIATVSLLWHIFRERNMVIVRVGPGLATDTKTRKLIKTIHIELINKSKQHIYISSVHFLTKDGTIFTTPSLSNFCVDKINKLEIGELVKIRVLADEVVDKAREFNLIPSNKVLVRDTIGNRYIGKVHRTTYKYGLSQLK